jgi:hypothetical protein
MELKRGKVSFQFQKEKPDSTILKLCLWFSRTPKSPMITSQEGFHNTNTAGANFHKTERANFENN